MKLTKINAMPTKPTKAHNFNNELQLLNKLSALTIIDRLPKKHKNTDNVYHVYSIIDRVDNQSNRICLYFIKIIDFNCNTELYKIEFNNSDVKKYINDSLISKRHIKLDIVNNAVVLSHKDESQFIKTIFFYFDFFNIGAMNTTELSSHDINFAKNILKLDHLTAC